MTHLTDEQFQRLTDGSLEAEQSEGLWHHLDSCEFCLDKFNQRLEEHSGYLAVNEETMTSNTFQRKLMQRINREEAARSILNFGYNGLSTVLALLVQAIFAIGSKQPPSSK
jgi:hypothetical protein